MTTTNIPMILIVDNALANISRRERARNFNGKRLDALVAFRKEMRKALPNTLEDAREAIEEIMWEDAEDFRLAIMAGDSPEEAQIFRYEMLNAVEQEIQFMINRY